MTATGPRRRGKTVGQVFWVPTLLALISIVGLLSALLGDGLFDLLSWLTLAVPIVVALWYWRPGRRPDTGRRASTS
jgi:hypothetical protein